jgi:hypothetical protein|tara:strand:+ start:14629 stop:16104 length:1476 start_codon:yes stop_codon:yes gene_type:complete
MGQFGTNDPLGAFSLRPMPTKTTLASNYLNFADGSGNDFAQQYLPEIYEAEVERYGNRTLSGFLRMVGAEMPMTSDQVIWSEQNRLHIGYENGAGNLSVVLSGAATAAGSTITLGSDHNMSIRVGNTVVVSDAATGLVTLKCYVSAINQAARTFTVLSYTTADLTSIANGAVNLFVFGSEFGKGTDGMQGSLEASFTQFNNKPIIIKDTYEISGSDAAQIGWVEVATEDGTSGYLWYLKSEGETRLRFQDYLEMAVVEGETATAASGVIVNTALGTGITTAGTEGLFAAITARGNVYQNYASGTGAGGAGVRSALQDFDFILQNLDKQGAIEENMLFLDRETSLDFDDMLAAQNSYGAGGTSYGVFENSEEMALNLGFDGFRRGSYDFYKTDWKYLNDATTRGMIDNVKGVMVPAGTSTVYDQMLGTNIRRPFLHVRYRASEADDRRMKSWITGSVGGAATSTFDKMEVSFLSERCLVTQAANNFVLFTAA